MNLGPPDSAPSLAVDTTSSSPLLLPSSGVGYHLLAQNSIWSSPYTLDVALLLYHLHGQVH